VITEPSDCFCPTVIVKPFTLSKSLTLSKVGMPANDCKLVASAPPDPGVITSGAPLNLTTSPVLL
jgi:hypothetical protein